MIEKYSGRVVGTAGDSILVEFASAVAAVECWADMQRGMDERNADLPEERRMLLRVGVNIGEVIVDEDDIYGDGVNVAARLQELAEPEPLMLTMKFVEVEGSVAERLKDSHLASSGTLRSSVVTIRKPWRRSSSSRCWNRRR